MVAGALRFVDIGIIPSEVLVSVHAIWDGRNTNVVLNAATAWWWVGVYSPKPGLDAVRLAGSDVIFALTSTSAK